MRSKVLPKPAMPLPLAQGRVTPITAGRIASAARRGGPGCPDVGNRRDARVIPLREEI